MTRKYRFGIIGCGAISSVHAQAITSLHNAELVAVADVAPEKAGKISSQFGGDAYEDYRRLIARGDIDIVNICVPSGIHGKAAIDTMKAGKHVIVEKPIDVNIETADEMIRVSGETGRKLAVVSQHRFDPSSVAVSQAVEQGRFGRLLLGNAYVKWHRTQAYYDSGEWRGTWALDGGGALINQSIHTIDLLQWIMGPVESIVAYAATLAHDIEVEDVAAASVRFQNGAVGSIEGTTLAYPGLSARLEVYGENGSAIIDNDELVHWSFRDKHPEDDTILGALKGADVSALTRTLTFPSHARQFADMIAAVEEDRAPAVDGLEGRKALEIVLAVYEAVRQERPVALPLRSTCDNEKRL